MLKQKQISAREAVFEAVDAIEDEFLEIDNENAVIDLDQLSDNDLYINRIFEELAQEVENYNRIASEATEYGVYLERIPVAPINETKYDLLYFTKKLSQKLIDADESGPK